MGREDVGRIHEKLTVMKVSIGELNKTIVDEELKVTLLRPIAKLLLAVESFLLPQGLKAAMEVDAAVWFEAAEHQVQSADQQLKRVQELVSKYGPSLHVFGERK